MIELLMLDTLVKDLFSIEGFDPNNEYFYDGKLINVEKLFGRYIELKREFLKPYVIDKTSKED